MRLIGRLAGRKAGLEPAKLVCSSGRRIGKGLTAGDGIHMWGRPVTSSCKIRRRRGAHDGAIILSLEPIYRLGVILRRINMFKFDSL